MVTTFRLRFTLLLLSMALPAAARAQVSAYLTYSPAHFSNVETGAISSAGGFSEATTSYWSSGVGGGVTLPVLHLPVVALNMDLRGSTRPGTKGVDSALLGLQLAVHPHVIPFKPYVQVSVGYLNTRTNNVSTGATSSTFDNKYLAYEVLGGVDYPLIHFIDVRLIEIGGGQGIGFDSRNASFVTVNTGLVVHF